MEHILPSEWITLCILIGLLGFLLWLLRRCRHAKRWMFFWACAGIGTLMLCALLPNSVLPLNANLFTGAVSAVLGVPGVCLLIGACLFLF